MINFLQGHVLEQLKTIGDGTVQTIVTSPPYWGLRAYGTEPQIWRNGHELCAEHEWQSFTQIKKRPDLPPEPNSNPNIFCSAGTRLRRIKAINLDDYGRGKREDIVMKSDTCAVCGAWRGELGQEPTPAEYVRHLVEIFRYARRTLRDDGTLWLNLGDSYAGGNAPGNKVIGNPEFNKNRPSRAATLTGGKKTPAGLNAKNLIGIPWRVAFALQDDGWILRNDIIWAKPNPMPESVTDRCTRSHEYVFLFSKSPRYYFDAEAIKEESVTKSMPGSNYTDTRMTHGTGGGNSGFKKAFEKMKTGELNGRNKRDVWTVSTLPYKGAHFATMPPKLVEPMILAGCPAGGTVLDPFGGSGTVSQVAERLGRSSIYIDLNPAYLELAQERNKQRALTPASEGES